MKTTVRNSVELAFLTFSDDSVMSDFLSSVPNCKQLLEERTVFLLLFKLVTMKEE